MAAQFMGDVCAKVGEYNDQQGNPKARYLKVGTWYQDDQGRVSVKLLAMPIAPDPKTGVGCWLSLFHKQDDNQQQGQQNQGRQQQHQGRQQGQSQGRQQQQQQNHQAQYNTDEVPF